MIKLTPLERCICMIAGVTGIIVTGTIALGIWIGFHFLTWIECRELHSFLSCLKDTL